MVFKCIGLHYSVQPPGLGYFINFEGCRYETNLQKEIVALKECNSFGRNYWVDEVPKEKKVEVAPVEIATGPLTVEDLSIGKKKKK